MGDRKCCLYTCSKVYKDKGIHNKLLHFAITGTPTVTIGGQDISETITGLTITSDTSELESITLNTMATYELILEVTGNTEFSKNLSYYEAYKITGSIEADSGVRSWGFPYWLRSLYFTRTFNVGCVDASGYVTSNDLIYTTRCARPAFKISIT